MYSTRFLWCRSLFVCKTVLCLLLFWNCDLRGKFLLEICLTTASVCYWLGLSHASIYFIDLFCVLSVSRNWAPIPEARIVVVYFLCLHGSTKVSAAHAFSRHGHLRVLSTTNVPFRPNGYFSRPLFRGGDFLYDSSVVAMPEV